MKKLRHFLFVASALLLSMAVTSCDNEYDLSKDIDGEMTIGKNFSIPVGKTDTIYLKRIIKEGENLKTNALTGIYQLNAEGEISTEIKKIDYFEIDGLDPHFIEHAIDIPVTSIEGYEEWMWEYRKDLDLPILKNPYELDVDVYSEAEYDIDITKTKLPSEIEKAYKITFNGDGKLNANGHSGARSVIKIFIPKEYIGAEMESYNGTHGIKEVHLKEVHIKFPEIFTLKDENQEEDLPHEIYRHDIYLKEDIDDEKNLTAEIEVYIESAEIPEELQDKYFTKENGDIYFNLPDNEKITITVDEAVLTAIPAELEGKQTVFDFTYEVFATNITSINGKFKPDVDINEQLALNDIPDFIKDETSEFKPNDLLFKITLDNPVGLGLSTSINITPYNNAGYATGNPVSIDITGDNIVKPNATTKLVISNKEREVAADETLIICPDLPGLISPIPDYYEITAGDVYADGINSTGIELGVSHNLSGSYSVEVPFSFEALSINYTDEITNLQEDLSDISDLTDEISIEADVESTIPVGLEISFKFFDYDGNELNEIHSNNITIDAGGNNGDSTTSRMKINLKVNNDSDDLERLEKIVYTINAANKVENISLSNKQYLLIKNIVAKIPNGITTEL